MRRDYLGGGGAWTAGSVGFGVGGALNTARLARSFQEKKAVCTQDPNQENGKVQIDPSIHDGWELWARRVEVQNKKQICVGT